VPRMKTARRMELETFWRGHLDGWHRSDLNQREYCELHGLPLKRFGNWRAKFKHEDPPKTGKLLYRRGGGLRQMSGHMSNKETAATYIPSAHSRLPGERRRFSAADKKRIIAETERPGASVSGVARQYDITAQLLFRWKRDLAPATETTFMPVTITDGADQQSATSPVTHEPAPVIIERSAPGIEVELLGGRRVRFARDVDPETVRRLVSLLEGEAQ
jgi:transposase-like protein